MNGQRRCKPGPCAADSASQSHMYASLASVGARLLAGFAGSVCAVLRSQFLALAACSTLCCAVCCAAVALPCVVVRGAVRGDL